MQTSLEHRQRLQQLFFSESKFGGWQLQAGGPRGGYVTPQRPLTLTGDTTLDLALDRVRVSIFGTVREAAPCGPAVQDARVEIVSGPDAGIAATSTATGYQLKNINFVWWCDSRSLAKNPAISIPR